MSRLPSPRRGRVFTALAVLALSTGSLVSLPAHAASAAPATPKVAGKGGKLSPRLAELSSGSGFASPHAEAQALSVPASGVGSLVRRKNGGVLVEIRSSDTSASAVNELRARGASVVNVSRAYDTVTASVLPGSLPAIAADPAVQYVSEVLAPQIGKINATPHATGGASPAACAPIVSEGDTLMNVDAARTDNNLDGSGETIGILSDSFNTDAGAPTHAADDVAAGELPGATNPCGYTTPVTVQADYSGGGQADEGRAMAQLAHGLAPGAHLAFATADNGEFDFASRINQLRTVDHASVIVDDASYLDEPFFQDGPIANAANAATAAGVPYFSAAGNSNVIVGGNNVSSYETPAFRSVTCPSQITAIEPVHGCHNFDTTGGSDTGDEITVAPGGGFGLDLQWAQPLGGVTSDYDVFIANSSGTVVGGSAIDNLSSQEPFEFAGYTNSTGSPQTVHIIVVKYSGNDARFKFVLMGAAGITSVEHNTSSGGDIVGPSIFGHNGTSTVASTGAIPYDNADTSEDYSSRGPETLYFQPSPSHSALGAPQVLNQPAFAATDNVQTSFFAEQVGGVWRFAGTSAAAPQAAAIGALLQEDDPALTPAQLISTLSSTARPVTTDGTPDAVGGGYLDADAALAGVTALPGEPSPPTTINGDSHVTVQWSVPASNPNFPVTGYTVTPYLGSVAQTPVTVDASTTSELFSGLTNGTTYKFTVTAINANGSGPESAPASVAIGVANPPTGIAAVAAANQVSVSWSAPPADDLTITGYTVATLVGGATQATETFNSTATTQTITGLTNGTTYTFEVASIDDFATGPFSPQSNAATPADVPDPPTVVTVYPYFDNAADVSWTAPANNGSPITNYIVTAYLNGSAVESQTFPATSGAEVNSLTNGQPYTFTVAAQNARGAGSPSAQSRAIIAGSPVPPAAPPTATPGNGSASVSWTAPQNHSSSPVSGYTVYAYVNGTQVASQTYNSTAITQVFGGLTNGTTYAFSVAAANANGLGPPTDIGAGTIVGTPSAPASPTAVPGNARATVHWTAPANNGAAISGYVITRYVGGVVRGSTVFNSAATTETVAGLGNGTSYTFTFAARNSRGAGPASVSTAAIIVGAPLGPTAVKAVPGPASLFTGSLTVSYSAGAANGAAITKYTATCTSPGFVAKSAVHNGATAGAIVVSGVTTKKPYTCRVTATNARGTSSASAASATVIVGTPGPPPKPTIVKTAAGSLKVSFTAPAPNGAAITSYTTACTSTNGGVTKSKSATASPITVTGLSAAKTYTCTVRATNSRGAGPLSPPSSPATA